MTSRDLPTIVPPADAAEQLRQAAEVVPDEEAPNLRVGGTADGAPEADWQEQDEDAVADFDVDDADRRDRPHPAVLIPAAPFEMGGAMTQRRSPTQPRRDCRRVPGGARPAADPVSGQPRRCPRVLVAALTETTSAVRSAALALDLRIRDRADLRARRGQVSTMPVTSSVRAYSDIAALRIEDPVDLDRQRLRAGS